MSSDLEAKIIAEIKSKGREASAELILGIGDDAAVIDPPKGCLLVTSSDSFNEGVHFLRQQSSAKDIGCKLIAVNVSDIAAMGAEPRYCMLSMSVPKDTDWQWISEFISGVTEACAEFGVVIIGGDTTASQSGIVLNASIIGFSKSTELKLRSAAKSGDWICVSGVLGDSSFVFNNLNSKVSKTAEFMSLKSKWSCPRPHLRESQVLRGMGGVHAMMDVSDGLKTDLQRLCQSSECSARIDVDKLPISSHLAAICRSVDQANYKRLAYDHAVSGGEDYCLLVTVERNSLAEVQEGLRDQDLELSVIGEILPLTAYQPDINPAERVQFQLEGKVYQGRLQPFTHF